MIIRATQRKMISRAVTSDVGRVEGVQRVGVCAGQPSVANGHSALENQVSSTSSSWRSGPSQAPQRSGATAAT